MWGSLWKYAVSKKKYVIARGDKYQLGMGVEFAY